MNVGIGVKAIIADHDLALVGSVRGHPGNELQIIHRLLFGGVLAVAIAYPVLIIPETTNEK
jgi:hypothetical protein